MANIKRGFLLSSSAMLLVLLVILTFSINNEITASESKLATKTVRVKILNELVNDLENNYFEKILYVSGKSALSTITEYKLKGGPIPSSASLRQDFSDVLSYGIIKDSNGISPKGTGIKTDNIESYKDNCRFIKNKDQKDSDGDGVGDSCKYHCDDLDEDGICDVVDNCPITPNADQNDADKNGIGDACQGKCDNDVDKDEVCDNVDACPTIRDTYNNCPGFHNDPYALIDDITAENMQDKSLAAFVKRIENILDNLGVKANNLKAEIISIKHTSPWIIDVEVEFKYNILDKSHIASWEGSTRKSASISIIGLKDPLTGAKILKDGASRWVQHSVAAQTTNGDSFLRRLDGSQLNKYGICKEDNNHCGTCENDCTITSKIKCTLGTGICT